jgi:hypothetical protein
MSQQTTGFDYFAAGLKSAQFNQKETNEHRTSNNVFCPFKIKTEQAYSAEMATKAANKTTLRNSIRPPRTTYVQSELMSKVCPELVEGYSGQAAGQYSTRLIPLQAAIRLS